MLQSTVVFLPILVVHYEPVKLLLIILIFRTPDAQADVIQDFGKINLNTVL